MDGNHIAPIDIVDWWCDRVACFLIAHCVVCYKWSNIYFTRNIFTSLAVSYKSSVCE